MEDVDDLFGKVRACYVFRSFNFPPPVFLSLSPCPCSLLESLNKSVQMDGVDTEDITKGDKFDYGSYIQKTSFDNGPTGLFD